MSAFTEGQRTRMRNSLTNYRASLLASEALIPVSAVDAGISSIEGILNSGCASTVVPQVNLQNYGSNALTEAVIHFALDGGVENTLDWSGSIPAGDYQMIEMPALSAGSGTHSLSIWTEVSGDGYGLNDTMAISFDVLNGDFLQICLLYTSPSPRDQRGSRMPSSA